jgi:hypothetical protein
MNADKNDSEVAQRLQKILHAASAALPRRYRICQKRMASPVEVVLKTLSKAKRGNAVRGAPKSGSSAKAPAPIVKAPSARFMAARAALAPFLEANPLAEFNEESEEAPLAIRRPWGDRSIRLLVPDPIEPFANVLNQLYLPPRYSAIWHRDTNDFEVLWSAFRLSEDLRPLDGRRFKFKFRDHEYVCEFGASSKRIGVLARAFSPASPPETNYRNLTSYDMYESRADYEARFPEMVQYMDVPRSFWIRNLNWNEDEILALITHLNFHLSYFDSASPIIFVHSLPTNTTTERPTRYPAGEFPKNVSAKDTDPNLLFLWEAARTGESLNRFLYYYRIIEYAAAVYLDSSARTALRIALALPNALDDLAAVTESVMAAVQKMKLDEIARYDAMLKEIVSPRLLWRELAKNKSAFTGETSFDGGFNVKPLFTADRAEASHTEQDVYLFGRVIRDMRNALSHGRDQKTGTTIAPSAKNAILLQPWVGPIRLVASQVLLYKEVF